MAPTRTRTACPERSRRDGWTTDRQARFLTALAATRSVTDAARAVGMSRKSAYRLRSREPDGLFAAMWSQCFRPRAAPAARAQVEEGHIRLMALACGSEGATLIRNLQHRQLCDLRPGQIG